GGAHLVARHADPPRRRPLRPPARAGPHPRGLRHPRAGGVPARRARRRALRGGDRRRALGGAMVNRDRRSFVLGLGAGAIPAAGPAAAMGRTPLGGRIACHVPWPTGALDPHDLRDPMAALFGAAVFDTLYALDANGLPYPTLTTGLPVREAGETVVHLREGL